MTVPHKVSQASASSLLLQRIIRQQEQARDAEKRVDQLLKWC